MIFQSIISSVLTSGLLATTAAPPTSPASARVPDAPPSLWMPEQASTAAPDVDFIFNFITGLSIFFFILIVVLMVLFVVKYRRREHTRAVSTVTHNTALELTWTIVPLILVISIFYVGMQGFLNLRRPPVGAYEVNVTGARWSWTFQHRNGCTETNILRVPVNRPVRLVMNSTDVLHSMYIPAFRVKQDVVPGRVTSLWFEATQVGQFDLFCAEYCGKDHSQMVGTVIVLSEEDFAEQLEDCSNVIDELAETDLPRYAIDRLWPRCSSCHTVDGRPSTGPTWQGLWERTTKGETVFRDGTQLSQLIGPGREYEEAENYIIDSILNPGRHIVAPYTNAMPAFQGQLRPREVTALVELIKRLDEFVGPDGQFIPAE